MTENSGLPENVIAALRRLGLLEGDGKYAAHPLAGGVSSDIWLVDAGTRRMCVKSALPRLRVAEEWYAPLSRNSTEVAWMRRAATIVPEAVPTVLGHDPEAGVFAMEYLPPESYSLWKNLLRDGVAREEDAVRVARILLRIHSATAGDADVAREFATDGDFFALRLEPYLLATAARNPDMADRLRGLVDACLANRLALVHGDVSPKNILIGPAGPVFLDAETAWYGDPAFDVAFCLNHLLLKCVWNPGARGAIRRCFDSFCAEYLAGVDWEPAARLERRVAALLPGLSLARIDGKSPVEYLDAEARSWVRGTARDMLRQGFQALSDLRQNWDAALDGFARDRTGGHQA